MLATLVLAIALVPQSPEGAPDAAPAKAAEGILRFAPTDPGEIAFTETAVTSTTLTFAGQKMEMKVYDVTDWVLTLKSRNPDGSLDLALEYHRSRGWIDQSDIGRAVYDSDEELEEEDADLSPFFEALTLAQKLRAGHTLVARITPLGEIVDIQGFDELYADRDTLQPLLNSGIAVPRKEDMMQALAFTLGRFPEGPVSARSHWSHPFTLEFAGTGQSAVLEVQSVVSHLEDAEAEILTSIDLSTIKGSDATASGQAAGEPGQQEPVGPAAEDAGLLGGLMGMRVHDVSLRNKNIVSTLDGFPLLSEGQLQVSAEVKAPNMPEAVPMLLKMSIRLERRPAEATSAPAAK